MKSHTHYLWFSTKNRQEIIDITDEVEQQVVASGVSEGFALVSAMHITASVFVNDHESGLWQDILKWLEDTVLKGDLGIKTGKGIYEYPNQSPEQLQRKRAEELLELLQKVGLESEHK